MRARGGGVGELLGGDGVLVVDDRLVDLFLPDGDRVVEVGDILVDTGDLRDELSLTRGRTLGLAGRTFGDAGAHRDDEQDRDRGYPSDQPWRRCVTSRHQ